MPQLLRPATLLSGFAPAIVRVGSGYSPSLDALLTEAALNGLMLDFAQGQYWRAGVQSATAAGVSGWSYTRSGTRFAGDSALTSFGANVPRIVPGSGIRVTAGATNLLLQSQTFDNGSWTKSDASITADNTTAPDGTTTADLMTATGAGSLAHAIFGTGVAGTTGTTYTVSLYVRASTGRYFSVRGDSAAGGNPWITVDLQTGAVQANAAVTSSSATALSGGWYRVVLTWVSSFTGGMNVVFAASNAATAPTTATNLGTAFSQSGESFLIWGAQLETGSTATDYISTTSSAASAGADAASVTGLTFSGAHSVIALTGVKGAAASEALYQLDDGTANNAAGVYRNTTAFQFIQSGGVNQSNQSGGSWSASAQKFALRVNTNDSRMGVDGVLGAADTVVTLPAGTLSRLNLANNGSGGGYINGWLQLIAILPRALSDSELQNGTA